MTTIAFVASSSSEHAQRLQSTEATRLRSRGHRIVELGDTTLRHIDEVELVVSLGGDGTMLRALDIVGASGIPVLGVNLGHLGYLAEVEPDDLPHAIDRYLSGDFAIEERLLLRTEYVANETGVLRATHARAFLATNEIVIERATSAAIRLCVDIARAPFLAYVLDAMIVATPTGSTAYNMSARGPIVSPTVDALLLTPVSPHMVFDRTMVLDIEKDSPIDVQLDGTRDAFLVVDGRNVATLHPGDRVQCAVADVRAKLVTFGGRNYREVVREKFGVTDR